MGLPVLFYWLIAYGIVAIAIVVVIFGFLFGGLMRPFLEVKRSRGKKILVIVRHPVQDIFRAGEVIENHLVYDGRDGGTRRIPMIQGVVSRRATIFWCEVDDEKNCFYKRDDGKAVATYDAQKTDSLLLRALYRPTLNDNDALIKGILVVSIVTFVVAGAAVYISYKNGKDLDVVIGALNAMRPVGTTLLNGTVI
jgi:hypothetical protein